MNPQNGLNILARRDQLNEDDWYALVEARAERLSDHLRSMTLKRLGDLQLLSELQCLFDQNIHKPIVTWGDKPANLETRGIFPHFGTSMGLLHLGTIRVMKLWGLTRDGKWVTIRVKLRWIKSGEVCAPEETKPSVTNVDIHTSDLKEVCAFSNTHPRLILYRLWEVAVSWAEQRKTFYQEAQALADDFNFEKRVLDFISNRPTAC